MLPCTSYRVEQHFQFAACSRELHLILEMILHFVGIGMKRGHHCERLCRFLCLC